MGLAIMRTSLFTICLSALLVRANAQAQGPYATNSSSAVPAVQFNYGSSCTATKTVEVTNWSTQWVTKWSTQWETKTVTDSGSKGWPATQTVTTCPYGYPPPPKTITSTVTESQNCVTSYCHPTTVTITETPWPNTVTETQTITEATTDEET